MCPPNILWRHRMSRTSKGAVPPRFCFACGSRFLASAIETSFHCSRLIENVFFCRVTKVSLHEVARREALIPHIRTPSADSRNKKRAEGFITFGPFFITAIRTWSGRTMCRRGNPLDRRGILRRIRSIFSLSWCRRGCIWQVPSTHRSSMC